MNTAMEPTTTATIAVIALLAGLYLFWDLYTSYRRRRLVRDLNGVDDGYNYK